MKLKMGPWAYRLLILPPLIVGLIVLVVVARQRPVPEQRPRPELACTLRVIEVPQVDVVPRVTAFGVAQPGRVWSAVAEVQGRVVEVHPELNAGAILYRDDVALRIDPTEYELRIAELEAEIAQTTAQISELTASEENYRLSLEIEEDSLTLAEAELQRLRSLQQTRAVTQSEIDEVERQTLAQRQSVQSQRSLLNVLPTQRDSLSAALRAREAALGRAQLDLDRTTIRVPFDCRLSEVAIEEGQFLSTGQSLFDAHGISRTEVEIQPPIDQVRTLLAPTDVVVTAEEDAMETMRRVFDVAVTVRMRTGTLVVEWPGRFVRVREQLDPQTRTIRIVVAVDDPYEDVIPGRRPPLTPGTFCEVELRGQPRTNQIVVPRTAVHKGHVYVLDDENRLVRRAVEVGFVQRDLATITGGLQPGERLVVSDPTPAMEGALVDPVLDERLFESLITDATGEGAVP